MDVSASLKLTPRFSFADYSASEVIPPHHEGSTITMSASIPARTIPNWIGCPFGSCSACAACIVAILLYAATVQVLVDDVAIVLAEARTTATARSTGRWCGA